MNDKTFIDDLLMKALGRIVELEDNIKALEMEGDRKDENYRLLMFHKDELEEEKETLIVIGKAAWEVKDDLGAENEKLREVLDRPIVKESPWPESVWVMTIEEYVEVVPDGKLRTAISGLLMRNGWQLAVNHIEEALSKDGE